MEWKSNRTASWLNGYEQDVLGKEEKKMNRRLVLGVIALFLATTSGCSGKESTTGTTPVPGQEVTSGQAVVEADATEEATQEDVAVESDDDIKAEQVEKDNGMIAYRVEGEFATEYDGSLLEASTKNGAHIFQKKSKDDKTQNDSNIFVSVMKLEAGMKKDMLDALQSNPEEVYTSTETTIGADDYKATKLAKENADGVWEYYLFDGEDATWLIEVKCQKSGKKKYEEKLNAVIKGITLE